MADELVLERVDEPDSERSVGEGVFYYDAGFAQRTFRCWCLRSSAGRPF